MRCIEVVLQNEGGYCNIPEDPGGETNFGICKRNYPDLDIKNLTMNQAIMIYFSDYWSPMKLTKINNENLILQIFDMGVNAGIRTAIKIIQGLVGAKVDGYTGPETNGLINASELGLVTLYKAERRKYYCDLVRRKPELHIFLKGWMNRVNETKFA